MEGEADRKGKVQEDEGTEKWKKEGSCGRQKMLPTEGRWEGQRGSVAECLPCMSYVLGSAHSITNKRQKGDLYGETEALFTRVGLA